MPRPTPRHLKVHFPSPARLRAIVYRTDACLAGIIDREQGYRPWSATVYNGGSHWHRGERMLDRSYGLPQALPPWKMASAGVDWRTNPWTQLRWARWYARERYGSTCRALAFWQTHLWW